MRQEEMIGFPEIVKALSLRYHYRNVELKQDGERWYLYMDGECKFCTTGYCLLYNLTRLCDLLKNELL